MKLLLTSGGITNQAIADAMFELVGKKPQEITLAFIPTAANVDKSDKAWFINDLQNIKKQNLKYIDIVDISALPKENWLPRLESVDVLFFSGGNSSHLMNWMKKSRLSELLPKLLETKVYVGISAGSIVTNPSLALSNKDKKIYYEEEFSYRSEEGLGFVDFYFRPHYNSPDFPHAKEEHVAEIAKETNGKIYALDDQSAMKVVDGEIEIISKGEYKVFN